MVAKREQHIRPGLLSDFILGSQDGLVNVLGILLGLSAATDNTTLIVIGALAALGAESVSMGAVAYTSTLARRRVYEAERVRELEEMRTMPDMEREEVRIIFRNWGFEGDELEEIVRKIEAKPKAMLELMMAFELNLSTVAESQPLRSGLVVLASTIVGSAIPIVPFLVPHIPIETSAISSIVLSAAALFGIGWYEASVTVGPFWRSGLRMLLIGMAAGFAGYLIGHFANVF
ncbi:MAG TPA: VIT1/CCC1 transporter family protein [Thermoplasmata archaeon]|nr:VIT1/CCC1 transporter family protein [Thermoplasmata archaeon]